MTTASPAGRMAEPPLQIGERPQGAIGRTAARGVMLFSLSGIAERLIGFVALAVVVRLMTVEEAGIAMLAASVFDVILVVSTTGFGERLIQAPAINRLLVGTVFWLKIAVCAALAIAFFLGAGMLARLFAEPRVTPLLQAMSVLIVMRCLAIVPAALLSRGMRYGTITFAALASSLASAAAGIAIALAGYPMWALVAQFSASSVVFSVLMFAFTRWRPPLLFSPAEAAASLRFGLPLLGSATLNALTNQVSTLMIGAALPIEQVAFFRLAARLYDVMSQMLVAPVQRVMLSTLSTLRGDRTRSQEAFLNMLRVLAAVAFAAYGLAAAQAWDLMAILFGARFAEAGGIFALLAIGVVGLVGRSFVSSALTSSGRTQLVLLYTALLTLAMVIVVAIAAPHGVLVVAAAKAALLVATVPLSVLALSLSLGIGGLRLVGCLGHPLAASLPAVAASYLLSAHLATTLPGLPMLARLGVAGAAGAIVFVLAHFLIGPRRTRRTVEAVIALARPRPAGAVPAPR